MGNDDDWTVDFFDDPYTQLFPFPSAEQTENEVEALSRLLPPSPARILDVACGPGRHAVRLAGRGHRVVGIDSSESFLEVARGAATDFGVDVDFIQADMRNVDYESEFDVALSLFTAWGYFDDPQNQQILDRVARSLRVGGRLIIDLIHRDWLISVYTPTDWTELDDGQFAVAARVFDAVSGINFVTHRWHTVDGLVRERRHRLRIYTATELDRMLRHAGLVPLAWYGGFSLEPFTHRSRRMLAVAERL